MGKQYRHLNRKASEIALLLRVCLELDDVDAHCGPRMG